MRKEIYYFRKIIMPDGTTNAVINTAQTVWIAWVWWASYYLYNVSRWKGFNFIMFIINIFLAWFVWYVVGGMLPKDFWMRDAFIAISWFSAFPILAIIESKFPVIFEKYLNNIK